MSIQQPGPLPRLRPTVGDKIDLPPHGYVRYIASFGTDQTITDAARVSYGAASKGVEADKKLLHRLYRDRHTSPFEQVSITFNIKFPIFLMRQFVRHRTFRLNEFSARYKELPDEFYLPAKWRYQGSEANKQGSGEPIEHSETLSRLVQAGYNDIYKTYQLLLEEGVSREQARMILPVGIYTEIFVNCDIHNLLGFLRLRLDPHAQQEMQEVAQAMAEIARSCFPWVMEAFDRYKVEVVDLVQYPETI